MNIRIAISTHADYWGDVTDEQAQAAAELLAERLGEWASEQWPGADVTAVASENASVRVSNGAGVDNDLAVRSIENYRENIWVSCLNEVSACRA